MRLTRRVLGCSIALATAAAALAPSMAQRQGGSLTVGMELDIPGFDPLKVGVFRVVDLVDQARRSNTDLSLDLRRGHA